MENCSPILTSVLEQSQFFLFGSYLNGKDFNDIDCLIVIPNKEMIAPNIIDELKMNTKIHFTIYLEEEFLDSRNKFSLTGDLKKRKVELSDVLKLMGCNNKTF